MTVFGFIVFCFLSINTTVHAADWKPEKPVEIVVNTVPGNGPDRTARVIQGIVQDKKQIEVPVVPPFAPLQMFSAGRVKFGE